ncbi:Uncharacterized protein C7orf31 [Exaiptasia diaphana]|nr:Uncharacterized protein C7orf31 [Exaiptasia diaphana]
MSGNTIFLTSIIFINSIPDPHKLDIGKHAIQLKFPSEHPYHSHIPKCALFPNFDSPDDVRKGKNVIMTSSTLPPTAAASAPDPVVVQKTKGHFARREIVQVQNESRKDPLIWNEHNYYQMNKTIRPSEVYSVWNITKYNSSGLPYPGSRGLSFILLLTMLSARKQKNKRQASGTWSSDSV